MTVTRCSVLTLSLLISSLAGLAAAQATPPLVEGVTADATARTAAVNPQIVRLSYVEGDVRVSPGRLAGHDGVGPWEQAEVNLPLETGFSVVTGRGRAEIEFEDASTMYLNSNTVLTFGDLTTRHGVPLTQMALLTGTATLHLLPTMAGEVYYLQTPSDSLHVPFGSRADLRVDSYLDAMTLTPQKSLPIKLNDGPPLMTAVGTSFTYSHGGVVSTTKPAVGAVSEWDQWVADRVAKRAAVMSAVMKEAGLGTPLPGLADMAAKGHFFACEPYGTCWEPSDGWTPRTNTPTGNTDGAQTQSVAATTQTSGGKGAHTAIQTIGGGGAAPAGFDLIDDDGWDLFPCSPFRIQGLYERDFLTQQVDAAQSDVVTNPYPYEWAVCHAGSWIRRNGRYAWVVGTRRHHHCPVHWVKAGGKLGYVPIHPRDVAGKEPLNLKHGIFEPTSRKGGTVRLAAYEPGKPVEVLGQIPKQFRQVPMPILAEAKPPSVEARAWSDTRPGAKPITDRPVSTIAFDKRAQGFTLVTRLTTGNKVSTVSSPMGGRAGMPQSGGSIFHGGYSGGGSSAGGHGSFSGASSGGGSHGSSMGSSMGSASGGSSSSGSSGGSAGSAHK